MKKEQLNEAAGRDWCENILDRELKPITKQAFKRGAHWHEALSLSDRLSESEIENIKAIYWRKTIPSMPDINAKYVEQALLEAIFGKDMFTI